MFLEDHFVCVAPMDYYLQVDPKPESELTFAFEGIITKKDEEKPRKIVIDLSMAHPSSWTL